MAGPGKIESDMIRVRLPEDLRAKWKKVLDGRGISQQRAVVSLVRWVTEQDPKLQVILFGQVPETDHADLAKLVLRELAVAGTSKAKK